MSIPIIGKEEDLEGCVAAPVLLQEIVRSCSEQEAIKKPVMTMLRIFAEMAQYAAHRNDPGMNFFALRLGLFPMSQEDLKKALDYELQRLKAFPNGEPQGPKETKEPVAPMAPGEDQEVNPNG